MKIDFKFTTGQKVKDKVSGLEGIIDAAAYWLNGCIRYSVQPKIKKGETTKPESWWMDEEQMELINEGVVKKIKATRTGGPSMKSSNSQF